MALTITATPKLVTFLSDYFIGAKRNTTITWDAGGNTKGRVFLSVNGGSETLFDGDPQGGNGQGSKVAAVQLGQTLDFRLRRANAANTLLASVKVTTERETLGLPDAAIEALKRTDLQHIYDLEVSPRIETVTITFRTRQPTNPLVYITEPSGMLAGLWARQEKKQDHSILFESEWLAQDTLFNYRIVAEAMPGSIGPNKVEATGTFRTGLRTATVFFDKIFMRLDGDPGSPGEFTFAFGAGDVDAQKLLGKPEFYGDETSITDGHTEQVDKVITIPTAPRRLWAQVNALEDDDYYNPFDAGFHGVGIGPSFEPPGTHGRENEYYAFASVTEHFDIGGTSETPFTMSTGLFAIAYNVLGRLRVEASNGEWLTRLPDVTHSLRRPEEFKKRAARPIWSARPGQSVGVTAANGHPHRVVLDPDGAVYHQALGKDPRAWRGTRWTSLGGRFEGPLTVVAVGPDQVSLFGLSSEGAVLHKSHAPDERLDEDWHTLGGDFVGPVFAETGEDEAIELFATSEDGSVFHRALAHPQRKQPRGEWERVGGGILGPIAALFSPRSGLSLFALGHGGEVLHKRRFSKEEEWRPADREWETLGVASDGLLSAEWVEEEGLLLAVVAEDETVRVLAWGAYPDAPPRRGWQNVGTINSLLQARGKGHHRLAARAVEAPDPSRSGYATR